MNNAREESPELKKIRDYWIEKGKKELDEVGLKPTARDPYLQMLNEYYILKLLPNKSTILDVGCGEGSSSIKFAKVADKLIGIDYAETLIEQAKQKAVSNTQFIVGDVLNLKPLFEKETFDVVVTIRCLINLPKEELQYASLENIFYTLKKGGILFFSEGYQDGWNGINVHRQRNGLEIMKLVQHNLLFNTIALERFFLQYGEIMDFIGFGEYLYGSRVIHPLLTKGEVRHDSFINKVFADAQRKNIASRNFRECDYAGIYVVKKYE